MRSEVSEVKQKALDNFEANPQLYPIVNGVATEEAEINQTLLAIKLFKSRAEDSMVRSVQKYLEWVLQVWGEWYYDKVRSIEEEVTEELINGYINGTDSTGFGNYVRSFIKNSATDDYEMSQIAYRFVQREPDGIRLITNQNEVTQI